MPLHLFRKNAQVGYARISLPSPSNMKSIHFRVLALPFHIQLFVSMVKYSHSLSQDSRQNNLFFIYRLEPIAVRKAIVVSQIHFFAPPILCGCSCLLSFVSLILSRQKHLHGRHLIMYACSSSILALHARHFSAFLRHTLIVPYRNCRLLTKFFFPPDAFKQVRVILHGANRFVRHSTFFHIQRPFILSHST